MKNETPRPEFVTEDHLTFLDDLRESGLCNMYGATPHIQESFPEVTRPESRKILGYWMATFADRQEAEEKENCS